MLASPLAMAAKKAEKPAKAAKKEAPAKAKGKSAPAAEPAEKDLGVVTVVGSKKKARKLPGSASYVDKKEIQLHQNDDLAKILKFVPGVYVRQEDGNGLLPGISLRGVDSGRSAKITMMEDGVLIAPAPYSSPSAYYTPTAGRMAGLEVLKGSSQIKYGPHTTGGVINYLSTPIPGVYDANLKMATGTNGERRLHFTAGDRVTSDKRTLAYLVELYNRSTDGFKEIDKTGFIATLPERETGFNKTEPMVKLSYEFGETRYNKLEFKWGLSDLKSNESYLGISDADFQAKANRRYAASYFDEFPTLHQHTYLRYTREHSKKTDSTTTVYYNNFRRSWFKHNGPVNNTAASLNMLKGLADGTWPYTDNNRRYYMQGAETILRHRSGNTTRHEFEFGARVHNDVERRVHTNVVYTISGSNPAGAPGPWLTGVTRAAGDNRKMETEAISLYAQDTIQSGRWRVTPGMRLELLDMKYTDYNKVNPAAPWERQASRDFSLFTMGVGATYQSSDRWSLLGGIHQGASPPGPDGATGGLRTRPYSPSADLNEERTLSFEFGGRYENPRSAFGMEAVLFYTDFNDLIVTGNAGAGGLANTPYNGGDITTQGLEFSLSWDPAQAHKRKYKNPWRFAFTWTDASIGETIPANGSLFSGGRAGNDVPYVPEIQLTFGTEIEHENWGAAFDAMYVDDFWTDASNTTSATDTRIGKTDSQFTVDLSGWAKISKQHKITLDLLNLFNQEYISARHPLGPRPGQPFTALLGLEWSLK